MGDSGINYLGEHGKSWSPIRGCTPLSPGCKNCWAVRDAVRRAKPGEQCHGLVRPAHLVTRTREHRDASGAYIDQEDYTVRVGPRWTGEVRLIEKDLDAPLRWRAPARIAACFGGDWCHPKVPREWRDWMLAVEALCPQHRFLHLTKRAEEQRSYLSDPETPRRVARIAAGRAGWSSARVAMFTDPSAAAGAGCGEPTYIPWPLPNVWPGTSVENQDHVSRITDLLATPAAFRWVSLEPLLGPLNVPPLYLGGLSWCVIGGESGPSARPCDLAWIRSVVEQGKAAGVPVYVKQLGALPVMSEAAWHLAGSSGPAPLLSAAKSAKYTVCEPGNVALALRDRKGADPFEWPEWARVQEFPKAAR